MKIALVGNQNSGKTTLFNLLTGSNQKIGNWPGVTIEQKVGAIKMSEDELVDLPGIYSLSPYTLEEDVSRKFVYNEDVDLIINIVDATSIERSLYLTTQLMELDIPIVVALNMIDMLEKKGITINTDELAKRLGVDVIPISALKNTGIEELLTYIKEKKFIHSDIHTYDEFIEERVHKVEATLDSRHKRFAAVKLLEGDTMFGTVSDEIVAIRKEIEDKYETDVEETIAAGRYDFITELKKHCFSVTKKKSISDKVDRVLLNKWAAIPIFVVIMATMYLLAVGLVGILLGDVLSNLVDKFGGLVADGLTGAGASDWAVSLVVKGMIGGVGAVLVFIPQLIVLFFCIAVLETSGYMSRIAFILDRIFIKFGLSGKSLIPFIVGTGCSVPGIMTSRTIEDENERKMTIMLTPFVPCSAKLPIIVLFTTFFFNGIWASLMAIAMYLLAVVIIIVSAIVMRKLIYRTAPNTFISELPEYKIPNMKFVLRDVFDKTWAFIKRAGSIIFIASVIVWVLTSFSWNFTYGVPVEESMLGGIGSVFSWLFYPMLGVNSPLATVSAIQGLIAKEQVVSSMQVIAGVSGSESVFAGSAFGFFTASSAVAYMAFNLFSVPCISAVTAMGKELKSKKRLLCVMAFQMILAFLLAYLIRFVGLLILGV